MMDKYSELFIKLTGGQFLWSEFRKQTLSGFFTYSLAYAIIVTLIGKMWNYQVSNWVSVGYFLCVALLGLSTFLSARIRRTVLIDGADMSKAKYALYLFIYSGLAGGLMVLLSLLGVIPVHVQ